ncbi:MAG: polysaccharide biosynthesis/export family protein [Bdellovibrionales bacterium]|nr:polysaccharide biosynthesis/export family protein [Bdellovibrionales bacterium]
MNLKNCMRCVIAFVAFGALGCGMLAKGNTRPTEELLQEGDSTATYVAKEGDVLMIKVWGENRLSGEVFVREDGRFTMPLINDVNARGRTLEQITTDVTQRLKEFIPAVSVTTTVIQSAPTRYYLSGQFNKPGEYRSTSAITLLQAIATGGGFAPFADESSIILIRNTAEGELRYELDYNLVVEGKEPNPKLKDGDVIAVK